MERLNIPSESNLSQIKTDSSSRSREDRRARSLLILRPGGGQSKRHWRVRRERQRHRQSAAAL